MRIVSRKWMTFPWIRTSSRPCGSSSTSVSRILIALPFTLITRSPDSVSTQ